MEKIQTCVKERPILFTSAMIQALLKNRKTQTRRIIKPQPVKADQQVFGNSLVWRPNKTSAYYFDPEDKKSIESAFPHLYSPYGTKGDFLWVQEEYSLELVESPVYKCIYSDGAIASVILSAKEEQKLLKRKSGITKKQPGRFMYRSCSRITLEVTDIRVQRLQDITEEEAIAEGIEKTSSMHGYSYYRDYLYGGGDLKPIESFRSLWESLHGKNAWQNNIWLWVVEFQKYEHS